MKKQIPSSNSRGITNVMIEIRNDLIAGEEGQAIWAGLLAGLLSENFQK